MEDLIAKFSEIFQGLKGAFGKYTPIETTSAYGNQKVDGDTEFLKRQITVEDWRDHIGGIAGIGVVPINQDNMVMFGAIDIDDYSVDLVSINNNIFKHELPLIVCRTKSGGAHLYCFTTKWMPAKEMRERLRDFASFLGFGNAEIFPKQVKIMVDRGDIGSWINLPYFDANNTQRFALDRSGVPIKGLSEFIRFVHRQRQDPKDLKRIQVKVEDILEGGPPCLNRILDQGGPNEGQRNKTLFNIGVYLMKAYPDEWVAHIDNWNQKFNEPLSSGEVETIKASLRRTKYNYQCSEVPLKTYCNSLKCRSCKFGVATGSDIPLLSALSVLKTDPPMFFIDVEEGDRLSLSAEQLQNPRLFQRVCMEKLHKIPPIPKAEVWRDLLVPLFETANVIDVPAEMTTAGMLMEVLEDFCLSQISSEEEEAILQGKIYNDEHYHYFRMKDFRDYMIRKKLDIKQNRVTMIFRDSKVEPTEMTIKRKFIRVWRVRRFTKPGKYTIPESLKTNEPY